MNQKNFAKVALVILVVVFVGVTGYFVLRKPVGPTIPTADNKSIWKTYDGDSFAVQYPANVFTMLEVKRYSTINSSQTKLILSSRVSSIDNKECVYSKNGPMEVCTIGFESGISFNETDGSVLDYTSFIKSTDKTTVILAGKQFIKTVQKFPDGTEIGTYYISLNSNRTLIVSRNVQGALFFPKQDNGFPQQSLFDQVLATLVIK